MRGAALKFGSLLLAGSLLAGCNGASYFPSSLFETIEPCPYVSGRSGDPVMDSFQSRWYSSHLRAAGEPRLGGKAPIHEVSGVGVLRFTWLRSFHVPVMVRVEATADGGLWLTATELTGAGGYEPGRIARRVERPLSAEETAQLAAMITQTDVLELPPSDDCPVIDENTIVVGADGARWIIEANGSTGYHYVNRWSPEHGAVRDLGLHLVALTGWSYDRIY